MPLELYINDEALDLEPGEVIAITKQINDIADVGKIKADGSNQFKLPKTANNRRILENAGEVTAPTKIPYKYNDARLMQDGIELLQKGKALVESTNDYYNVQIVSGNKSFFDIIEGKTLNDLDFSEYDHFWSHSNIINSRHNNEGFIYPIVNWNGDGTGMSNDNRNVDASRLYPFTFAHTILSKICSEAGFSMDGNFMNEPNYMKLLIGPGPDMKRTSRIYESKRTIEHPNYGTAWDHYSSFSFPHIVWQYANYWTSANALWSLMYDNVHIKGHFFLHLKNTSNYLAPTDVRITYSVEGGEAYIDHFFEISANSDFQQIIYFEKDVEVDSSTGVCQVYVQIQAPGLSVEADSYLEFTEVEIIKANQASYESSHEGKNYFAYSSSLPKMKQTDFIKGIAQLYGLVFQMDNYSNTIHATKFNTIGSNTGNALDWSQKLDTSKNINIEYRIGNYAQKNYLYYTADTEEKEFASDLITVVDETLALATTIVQSPFSATIMTTQLQGLAVPKIPMLEGGLAKKKPKPRILVLDRQANLSGSPIQYSGSSVSTNVPLCFFDKSNDARSLHFKHIKEKYYYMLENILNQAKKVTAYFKLTQNDIAELDHFIPVYIEYFGHYFYINKINNHVNGKSTKCELIRL